MKIRIFSSRRLSWLAIRATWAALLAASLILPQQARADGCFVMPRFVWDKQKDINEPTQKAIMIYDAGREDLMLQVKYDGPVEQFGWLVPVPSLPKVQKGSMECFYELSRYTQEHWEPHFAFDGKSRHFGLGTLSAASEMAEPEPVKVVEIKTVGAYEVAVLSATDPGTLETWLEANDFSYPKDKADVIDDYVKQHWYFIAIKIDLGRADGFRVFNSPRQGGSRMAYGRVAERLSSGELQPLWISFASDQCVFPLKISSVNGTSSEVQVYVLSPDPLVERRLFEKKFPEVRQQAMAAYERTLKWRRQSRENLRAITQQFRPSRRPMPLEMPEPDETNLPADVILRNYLPPEAMLHYGQIGAEEAPACARLISGFRGKSWWLTKQTWTFKPEEMQDLVFQPAAQVFLEDLAGDAGYYAANNLAELDDKAVPAVVQALQSPNPQVRVHAMGVFEGFSRSGQGTSVGQDPRVLACLPALFQDPEWEVRRDAAGVASMNWEPKFGMPLVGLLRDTNEWVRSAAAVALSRNFREGSDFRPALEKLLTDEDLKVRAAAVEAVGPRGTVPVADLVPLMSVEDPRVLNNVVRLIEYGDSPVSYGDLMPLLRNKVLMARLAGLRIFEDLDDKQSVGVIIPLLRDPEPMVQDRAWELLKKMTGQEIPEDRPEQWEQWWQANRLNVLIADYTQSLASDSTNGELHHVRGCLYYDIHDFPKALADFQQACKLVADTPDYPHFRLWILRARLGEPAAATRDLERYLDGRKTGKPGDWPSMVGSFLAGRMSEVDFLAAAQNGNPQTDREQHCEAWYYAGAKRVIAGDKDAAAEDFKKCLATGVDSFEEYDSAAVELKWLESAPHGEF